MKFMHGMDSLTRQTQTHIEYEPEWETSFNLLIKLQKSISALIEWCSSDRSVYLECYKYLLHTIQQVETTETQFKYNYAKKHLVIDSTSYQYEIIDYSIMKQEVSIHATLTRLFSAVFMHMEKFDLNFNSIFNEIYPGKQDASSKQKMIALLEPSIRALVLVSQTNAGLWKRNGFSLLSQVYFYSNIKCRHEMFDRDILCLQMGASVMDPNEFLVNLLVHYSLYDYFMDEKFDLETGATTSDSKSDTELKQPEHFIPISEDFLELLIHILSERYDSKISKVEQNKRLEREVIHQLCVSPMAHSDLVKNIYPDNEKYTSDLEAVLNRIAFFKTSAPTSNAKGNADFI
jgi:E3 ubiquitin-protein ligase UBR2